MKLFVAPKSLLFATLLVLLSTCATVNAKITGFLNPFEQVPQQQQQQQQQHAQDMKKTMNKRRLEAARRQIAMKRQEQNNGGDTVATTTETTAEKAEFHRGLSSKKASSSMSKSGKSGKGSSKSSGKSTKKSSSKSGKGSKKKSTKRSSGKGDMVAIITNPPTNPPTVHSAISQDDGPMSFDDLPDINNTPPPIVSEDIPVVVMSQDEPSMSDDMPDIDNTPPPISDDRGPVSEDFRAPPMSEDQPASAEDSSDAAQDNGSSSTGEDTEEEEEPATDQGTVAEEEEEPEEELQEEEDEEEEPVATPEEILTDSWEFAMVRTQATSSDSEEDFDMTSVIVMAGVIYDFNNDGSVNLDEGVGDFSALCTVVSSDHNVLCTYKVHLMTPGGVGELIAHGHVVDHQNENLALVTGTALDMAQYQKGGMLVMQPNPDDVLTLTCSLTLRYV